MAGERRFRTTRWSLILAARAGGEPGSEEALARLCETYWHPVYSFVRRSGYPPDDAMDLTQGYFLRLIEKGTLGEVRPEAGRFRSFVLASLKHFLANARRDAAALKRGGGQAPVSLDAADVESRYTLEPADARTPETAYERQWALALIDRAHASLRAELEEAGRRDHYAQLSGYLTGDDPARPYREVAAALGMSEPAVKMAVSRLRRRFGRLLRREIALTVDDESEVEDEVRHLLRSVAGA